MARRSKYADSSEFDFEKELKSMEMEFELESRRNKKALRKLTKESDFSPFLVEDRVTPYSDIADINGSFNGRW